ncbi:MAG: methyltransferase domain-containing protein [Deltaproteobacteria bacterium]|nr:methyltransferase domain-containing protein [Deltaproteobacteria bacterium]
MVVARPPAPRTLGERLFHGAGARAYDALTDQPFWHDQIERLLDLVPPATGPVRVLDLGAGPGAATFVLAAALPAGSQVVGVDLSPAMIARARAHHGRRFAHLRGVSFVEGDARALPFPDASFDLVTGHSFLYLLPDPVAVLAEARRLMRPGAQAVFLEPADGTSLVDAARRGLAHAEAVARKPAASARFALSMLAWRAVSGTIGRMTPDRLTACFEQARLEPVTWRYTLGGLALHGVARRGAAKVAPA